MRLARSLQYSSWQLAAYTRHANKHSYIEFPTFNWLTEEWNNFRSILVHLGLYYLGDRRLRVYHMCYCVILSYNLLVNCCWNFQFIPFIHQHPWNCTFFDRISNDNWNGEIFVESATLFFMINCRDKMRKFTSQHKLYWYVWRIK